MTVPPANRRIILIDADEAMRTRVFGILTSAGYQVEPFDATAPAMRQLGRRHYDALIAGADLSPGDAAAELRGVLRLEGRPPLLLLCDPTQVELAGRLMRQGADDYLLRPPDAQELRKRLERILDRTDMHSRIAFFQGELSKKYDLLDLEVRSPGMRAVVDKVLRVAPMRATVLVLGESGVGKELVARSIHFNSTRRDHPFIALNCAAIPASLIESELFGHERGSFTGAHARARGKFEIAHRGTLFLDEIGEMEPTTQVKLLRVLEEREFMRVGGDQSVRVDVRVIAATNADLDRLVADSRFRQDLYYRLKVVTLRVPPLRERRVDIPHLTTTFIDQLSRANAVPGKVLTPEAVVALQNYHWPGNVRELKNVLESVLVSTSGETIQIEDLPRHLHGAGEPRPTAEFLPGTRLVDMERELIRRTLEHTGGNRTHSADLLGIGVRTLQRKIAQFQMEIPSRRRRRRRKGQPAAG